MGDDNTFTITLDNDDIYGGASGSAVTSYDTNFTFDTSSTLDVATDWSYSTDSLEVDSAMRKRLEAIESRLNILVPDPKKLEKFEALKKAYEHYKHIERLCEINDEDEKEGPNF